jgi:hypothetical protein
MGIPFARLISGEQTWAHENCEGRFGKYSFLICSLPF